MYYENELYHYGVKGMRWGVRRNRPTSSTYNKVQSAKAAKKQAKKQYSKDYNSARAYSTRHLITQFTGGKNQKEADRRWNKAIDSASTLNAATKDYRAAKKERKTAIKETTKKLNSEATRGEKLTYSDAVRKKAAKYIVDNDMSVAEATKKAKGDAWRNSAMMVGAYAGVKVASLAVKQISNSRSSANPGNLLAERNPINLRPDQWRYV